VLELFGEIENTDGVHGFAFVQDRKLGFVTNGRANTITVINLDTLKVVDTIQLAHWLVGPCEAPSGLAIDARNERLFTVCANQHMVVVNAVSGQAVADLPIGGHPDTAAFDPALKLAFSWNGANGTLTVVHEDDANHYSVLQNVQTLEGAKTMTLDPQMHRTYLVSSKFGRAEAVTAQNPHPRPPVIPGTFEVLVAQRK
jgi:YVTN family beta-propeller protein